MQIFISYSHKNSDFALRLRDQLRTWQYDIWIDIDNVPEGAYWPEEIDHGLEKADTVVGLFSADSVVSRNCRNEWDWALDYNKSFIPLRLNECRISHRYIGLNYIDFVENEAEGFRQLQEALRKTNTPYHDCKTVPATSIVNQTTGSKSRDLDNRSRLLDSVRKFWIEGVLEKSKLGDVWLDLPAGERPQAVEPTIQRQLKSPDFQTVTLKSATQIADTFRRTGRALLILGAPGSGKTMTLLELAKNLIVQAAADRKLPIPVVLNLASWAEQRPEKLEDWLVERLHLEYGVTRKLGKRWIQDGNLLFLLDGLDEVPENYRDACVTAINNFWQYGSDWVDNGIVVCSRIEEYNSLTERLHLQVAIALHPLTSKQADNYLAALGSKWSELRAALSDDPVLGALASSPLLLNIMAVAYGGLPKEEVTGFNNSDDQKQHLFEHYVTRCLRENSEQAKYSNKETRHYLSWLARQMIAHEQIVFHIEGLQSDWLEQEQQEHYRNKSVVRLVEFLDAGPSSEAIKPIDRLSISWSRVRDGLLGILLVGLLSGLVGGWVVGLVGGSEFGLLGGLLGGIFAMLVSALGIGINTAMIELRMIPNQGIHASIRNAYAGLLTGLGIGLCGGLLSLPITVLIGQPVVGLLVVMAGGLGLGLITGLIAWRVFSLAHGLTFGTVFGLLSALIASGKAPGIVGPLGTVIATLLFGLLFSLCFALRFGGKAAIKHIVLRRMLWRCGNAPFNYAEFLQYTSSHNLTRQVGGGFVFRHRMLMEHFANQAG